MVVLVTSLLGAMLETSVLGAVGPSMVVLATSLLELVKLPASNRTQDRLLIMIVMLYTMQLVNDH